MRHHLFSFTLLSSVGAFAQNWALLNPTSKYNYSNDGSDTISSQIFVSHVDMLGLDSFRYELNTVTELCDTCTGPDIYLWTNAPQFLQRTVNVGPNVWHFHGPGSFVILPQAQPGSPWLFDTLANVQAMVTAIDTVDQFGTEIPRKTVELSNGDVLMFSEEYGILSWGGNSLIGVHGPDVGRLIPSMAGFFPYQPGDQIQYTKDYGNCCPFNGENRCFKFTFGGANASDTAIEYTGSVVAYTHTYLQYVFDGPVSHTYDYQNGPWTWTAGNSELPFFDLVRSYPGQLVSTQTWGHPDGQACVAWHGMDSLGRYQIRCTLPGPDQFISPQPTGTEGLIHGFPGSFCTDADENCDAVYTEGIGLVHYGVSFFETGFGYSLDGAVIAGDTMGSLLTDDQILAVNAVGPAASTMIFPNPASDRLSIHTTSPSPFRWHILSITGTSLLTDMVSAEPDHTLDVSTLPTGTYVLELMSSSGISHHRFIIAR